jgi:hypothetical protein
VQSPCADDKNPKGRKAASSFYREGREVRGRRARGNGVQSAGTTRRVGTVVGEGEGAAGERGEG